MSVDKLLNAKKLLIYGAGALAKGILPYIKEILHDTEIVGFAVTELNEIYSYHDFKIAPLKSYIDHKEDALVLVATSDRYHEEIVNNLMVNGFTNTILLTNDLRDSIVAQHCLSYFPVLGIELDKEVFEVGNIHLLNPRFLKAKNSFNIFNQVADLLLPTVYNEWSLLTEGPYESDGVSLLADDIVLDCGANMGVFSAYAASKKCQVFAFEPTRELVPIIKRHSMLNGSRIIVVESAVSDMIGEIGFVKDSYNCGANSIVDKYSDSDETVSCTTIDDFVKQNQLRRVDFIKADIEGAERKMLHGAFNTLKNFAPKLSVCTYHLPDDKAVLEKIILDANPKYRVIHKNQKLYAWVE